MHIPMKFWSTERKLGSYHVTSFSEHYFRKGLGTLHRPKSALTATAIMAFLYHVFVVFAFFSGEAVFFSLDILTGFTFDGGKLNLVAVCGNLHA